MGRCSGHLEIVGQKSALDHVLRQRLASGSGSLLTHSRYPSTQISHLLLFPCSLSCQIPRIAFLISIPQHLFFQKSLKQRLGKSNIQARLGRPIGSLARGAIGGRGLPIIQRGLPRGGLRGGRASRTLLRGGMSLRGQCCYLLTLGPIPSLFSWAAFGHICLTSLRLNLY